MRPWLVLTPHCGCRGTSTSPLDLPSAPTRAHGGAVGGETVLCPALQQAQPVCDAEQTRQTHPVQSVSLVDHAGWSLQAPVALTAELGQELQQNED